MTQELLRVRKELCCSLRTLATDQAQALSERDYDRLIAVLAEKSRLLDRLGQLTEPVREYSSSHLDPDERAAANTLMADANLILMELADAEHQAVAELLSQRAVTERELREIAAAGQVHSAYRDSLAPVTHRSLDVDR